NDSIKFASGKDSEAIRAINGKLKEQGITDTPGSKGFSLMAKNLPATYDLYLDSISRLSSEKRPNWITRGIVRQYYKAKEMGQSNFFKALIEQFEHTLPKMMFFLV